MSWADVTELARSLWTVWLVLIFAGIAFYAFRPRNKRRFEDCAHIPLRAESEERRDHE
jgi:cytochrome c oxidase cbb3-type subunit 4